MADAASILDQLCERPLIEKTRYREEYQGHLWEIDEFHADNEGLILAELEPAAESERYATPPWAGAEVSSDPAISMRTWGSIRTRTGSLEMRDSAGSHRALS